MKRLITILLCLSAIMNVSAGCSKNETDTKNQISFAEHDHTFADTTCEHTWLSATYDAPMTCSGCGITQGRSIDYDNCLFRQGMTPCGFPTGDDRNCGYVDINGNTVIEPRFMLAYGFARNGLARIGTVGLDKVTYGYINTAGDFVIEEKFTGAGDFAKNGLAAVRQDDESGYDVWGYDAWGYIDENGKYVIPRKFEEAGDFAENGLAAVKFNGQWGYIDETGAFIIEAQFDEAAQFTDEGIATVVKAGETMYIDENGDPIEHDSEAYPFDLKPVQIGEKAGYEDREGNVVIEAKFSQAYPFGENGIALVKVDGLYGYINTTGEYVIEPIALFSSPPEHFSADGYIIIDVLETADTFTTFVTHIILDENGNQVIEPKRGHSFPLFDEINKN